MSDRDTLALELESTSVQGNENRASGGVASTDTEDHSVEFEREIYEIDDDESERRGSYRCPIVKDYEKAILRTRRKEYPVKIVEESAGGLGILLDKKLKVRTGDIVTVTSFSYQIEARVVYFQQSDEGFRVGLERVREIPYSGRGWTSTKGQKTLIFITALSACAIGLFGLEQFKFPDPNTASNLTSSILPAPRAAGESSVANSARNQAQKQRVNQIIDETIRTLVELSAHQKTHGDLTLQRVQTIQSAKQRIDAELRRRKK